MAQYPGIPWDQRPDYVALTQRTDPAGAVTTYNPPRPGVSQTDFTSFVFGQATVTRDTWPEVMYYLHPTPEWVAFRRTPQPAQMRDAQGRPMVERFPRQGLPARPLLDFPILPERISSREELWWIELWRRMDPRIHWEDILMRIEVPNRTVGSDRHLQNSTNNLINRQEHRTFSMLSWQTTGARGMRPNTVRTLVLQRVAAANPPLPPNSTRGLTPGLRNPALGNVPGNVVPWPAVNANQGRLRVGLGRAGGTQAVPLLVPVPAPPAPPPAPSPLSSSASASASEQASSSDESQSSEEIPLRITRARNGKAVPSKREPSSQDAGRAKKRKLQTAESDVDDGSEDEEALPAGLQPTRAPSTAPRIRSAARESRRTRRSAREESIRGQGLYEEGEGIDEAAEARILAERSFREAQEARDDARAARAIYRRARAAQEAGKPGTTRDPLALPIRTPVPSPGPPTTRQPRQQRISAITGRPFAGPRRRPEALGPYGDESGRRRSPIAERDPVPPPPNPRPSPPHNRPPPPNIRPPPADTSYPSGTRFDITGRPYNSVLRPPPPPQGGAYGPTPEGLRHQYAPNPPIPPNVEYWGPSSTRTPAQRQVRGQVSGYTQPPPPPYPPQQRQFGHSRLFPPPPPPPTYPPYPTDYGLVPSPHHPHQAPPPPTTTSTLTPNQLFQLLAESTRHNQALQTELHRRATFPREELGRHGRNVWEILGRSGGGRESDMEEGQRGEDEGDDYVTGFLEREEERERERVEMEMEKESEGDEEKNEDGDGDGGIS